MRSKLCLSAFVCAFALAPEASAQRRVNAPRVAAPRVAAPRVVAPRAAAIRAAAAPARVVRTVPMRTSPLRAGVTLRAAAAPRVALRQSSPVVTVLQRMETTLQYTRFSADNRIDPLMGHYEIDAPGLVTWVLRRATPAASRAVFSQVRARSPTARDYHDILAASPEQAGDAWQRIATVGALRPGDVVAWRRPSGTHNGGTHVAFVVAPPVRAAQRGGWLVRVTDATAVPHDNDTRGPQSQHHSGLGTGTLLLTADAESDAPTGYGWLGARTSVPTATAVALGRPLR